CVLAIFLVACAAAFLFFEKERKRKVEGVLRTVTEKPDQAQPAILMRRPGEGDVLGALLRRFDFVNRLQTQLMQAGLDWGASQVIIASWILGVVGAVIGWRLNFLIVRAVSCVALAVIMGSLPYVYVK